jgi:pyruvate dehydrogenase E2 component (dihydrolipoamide acetyltransferase)
MVRPITMPKLGQSEEEVTLLRWIKKEGDPVAKGDILFEIETEKAVLEVESFFAGTLLKIVVPEGGTVPVQSVVGFIGEPGEPVPEVAIRSVTPQKAEPGRGAPVSAPLAGTGGRIEPPLHAAVPPQHVESPESFRISPRAARLARESGIDPRPIRGTGPEGRIVERDVRAYLEAKGYDRLRITPTAKKLATSEKIDVLALPVPGDATRIRRADVERAIAERPKPMSRMRQVIAARVAQSAATAPHFFVTVSVDLTELSAWREELKAAGRAYTVTDFILKAAALALVEFPDVNSTTDGRNVWWHSKVHLGLVVSLEQGLVVPVIRNADDLTLEQIHRRAAELTDKARAGKLTPEEMSGSTFTVSNMGMLDVENFTAIINPEESAILAVSSAMKQPVVKNDQVVIRSMMKMTLSCDHRIIDGALAARFINAIKHRLEETSLWKRLA